MNKLVLTLVFLGASLFTYAQIAEIDEIRFIKQSDPKCYSVPETSTADAESVKASFNCNNLFISIAGFTGNVLVEVSDANNQVVISNTQRIVKQAVLTYSIGKLKPGVYTLVVTASGKYFGEFYKKPLEKTITTKESLVFSSLSYQ